MNPGPLQTQMDALQAQLRSLQQTLQQTQQALEASRRENTLLRQKLDALARRFFGKKSEALSAAQLELLLSGLAEGRVELTEEDEPPALPALRRPRTHPRGLRTPDRAKRAALVRHHRLPQGPTARQSLRAGGRDAGALSGSEPAGPLRTGLPVGGIGSRPVRGL